MFERVIKPAALIIVCCAIALAQSERGSIRGTIEDATGSVVPAARVTATSTTTGVSTTTQSTDAGNYNIPQLPPGVYTVSVEKTGFKKLVQENVEVRISGISALDLRMELGQVTESVTVSAAAPMLKSEASDVSVDISPKAYIDLPVTSSGGRSPEAFMFLSPGVTPGGNSPTNNFDAHVNGSQTLSKELQIDGMSTQIAEVQGDPRTLTFPPDAIQQMSVVTSSYPAEYGNTGGGVERFVVKSGTNGLHGNLYEFLRNEKFDARGFFNADRSVHHENEFGGTVGGPVVIPKVYNGRNKTFFFTNLHWYKNRGGAQNSIASVPNQAFRNGDLSGLVNSQGQLIQIYDPATTTSDGQGGFTRQPFPGNIIPANRISNAAKNILSYVPLPKLSGVYNNYPASGSSITNNHNWTVKADEYISSEHHLSGFWNQGTALDNGPYAALPHPVESSRDGNNTQKSGRVNYDWTISPTLLNAFRIGFNRQHQLLVAPETTVNYGQQLGIPGINNGFPAVTWGAFTALAQNQDRIEPVSNTFLYADSLSWTKNKHNFKFGFDLRRLQHNGRYPSRDAYFTFSALETAFPTGTLRGTTGNEFASFLLGSVDNASMYVNDAVIGERTWYAGIYAQDDWKISPTLTVNLGVRWDLFTPWAEVANRYSIMDPTKPNPAAGGLPGAYVFAGGDPSKGPFTGTKYLTTASDTAMRNFAPRLGFAWRLRNRFVIRSGYGISYYPNGGLGGGNVTTQSAGYSTTASFVSPNAGLNPAFNWDQGFPQNYPHPPVIDAGLNVGQGAAIWWDNAALPMYKQDWNFTTQTQISSSLALDIGYVGSKSTRLNSGAVVVNQVNPRYLSLGSLLQTNINDPAVAAFGFRPPYAGFDGSLAQALRPFPQYLGVSASQSANIGNATYHSLQMKLEKRFSKGLWMLASYTWSKTLTDANSSLGSFFSPSARDNYNRRLEKALAIYDVPSRLVAAFNYELPIGTGKPLLNRGLAGKLIGGWQVNGVVSYQSGVPIQISANNTLPLFNGGNTPNSVQGQKVTNSTSGFDPATMRLLNASAFAIPGTGQFGSSAQVLPNARNFPVYNEDLGLMKKFVIGEQRYFELRFEMFNAFNRVVFGGPATNINNANFGQVTSQGNGPRNGQIAGKFYF